MLAGNKFSSVPKEMVACKNLELFRISANQMTALPLWIFQLPKLTWFAYAGNPFCAKHPLCSEPLEEINWKDLRLKELLGQGASGVISNATWVKEEGRTLEVAVKEFKGEMTSDGLPKEEMDINIAIGHHDNLIDVLGKVKNHPDNRDALVLELIPLEFYNLGNPPSFETCSRDTYEEGYTEPFIKILKILKGIASAAEHIHKRGIMHGDFYAHNILINAEGDSLLGDFGGASYYEPNDVETRASLERLEVRAFGCLVEEMLNICEKDDKSHYMESITALAKLRDSCMDKELANRPLFSEVCSILAHL